MDIEDYERDRAEKKLLMKLQEVEEAVKGGEGWLDEDAMPAGTALHIGILQGCSIWMI